MAQEEKKWKKREMEEQRQRQHDISVLKTSLSNQINERNNNVIVERKKDEYFGEELKKQADKDYERDQKEIQIYRDQQKEYFESLGKQVKIQNKKKRVEDMMTEQERQLNNKDIEAYQNLEPKLHSNKIGYKISPPKEMDMAKIQMSSQFHTDRGFSIKKQNLAHKETQGVVAPHIGLDYKNQDRYIGYASYIKRNPYCCL